MTVISMLFQKTITTFRQFTWVKLSWELYLMKFQRKITKSLTIFLNFNHFLGKILDIHLLLLQFQKTIKTFRQFHRISITFWVMNLERFLCNFREKLSFWLFPWISIIFWVKILSVLSSISMCGTKFWLTDPVSSENKN